MASADSKFYDLSDADIDSYNDDAIPENTKKTTARGGVFACCQQSKKLKIHRSEWVNWVTWWRKYHSLEAWAKSAQTVVLDLTPSLL